MMINDFPIDIYIHKSNNIFLKTITFIGWQHHIDKHLYINFF
jgi:hypothetical protein